MNLGTSHSSGIITLNYCVMNLINELSEDTKYYQKYLQLAIDAVTEVNIFHINNIRVAYLTTTAMAENTGQQYYVDLPDDFVDYYKIGINKGGKLWTLTLNNNYILPKNENCGELESIPANSTDASNLTYGYYYTDHFKGQKYVPYAYSLGGGINQAYFRIDKENRRIVLSGAMADTEIILEYKSTGINMTGETLIPRQAVGTIKAYIHWKRLEYDPRVSMNEKMRKEQLYGKEIEQLRHHELMFTISEYQDMLYSTMKQTPKR